MISGVDNTLKLRLIEQFLHAQDGILDASTWLEGDRLRAQVTVISDRLRDDLTEAILIERCQKEMGAQNAPIQILVLLAKPRAVIRAA
jgi:hypothetical protein